MQVNLITSLIFTIFLLGVNATVNSQTNIDNTSGWNGTDSISSWGVQVDGGVPKYGQLITATENRSSLTNFTFYLNSITNYGTPFNARVYEVQNINTDTGIITANSIFTSPNLIAPNSPIGFVPVKVDTNNLSLTPGAKYLLVFEASSGGATYGFANNTNDTLYNDGVTVIGYANNPNFYSFFGNLIFTAKFSPSETDTRNSFELNSSALRNALNLQSAKIAQGLTYDCTVFDVNNVCVSFAGTRSYGNDGIDNTTGALIIAHRPIANIRVGGYVDQSIGTNDSNGLKVKRGSPSYGLFGVWSQRTDGLGTQVRLSANAGKVEIETTRQVIGTAEAGFGQSNIKSNGVQLEVSYGFAASNNITVRPYLGYRKMSQKRAAYTEQSSDAVSFPLQYTGLKQSTDSVLVGVRFVGKLTPQTSATLATGFEHNVKNTTDDYQAINADIGSISTIGMKDSWMSKTRPTASLGLVHNIDKKQTVGLSVTHRKEVLQTGSITMGMLQYSVGF